MSTNEIDQFIQGRVDEGAGPNEIAEDLDLIYGLSASDAHKAYCRVRGLENPNKGKRDAAIGLWTDDKADTIYRLLLLGKSFEDIAKHFNIDKFKLNTWKHEIPECSEAWERALNADFEVVENLLKLCRGYEEDDVKIGFSMGDPVYADYTKKFQPSLSAINTWLKARHPAAWKETQVIEANMTHTVENMSEEEIEQKLKEFGVKVEESNLSKLEVVVEDD